MPYCFPNPNLVTPSRYYQNLMVPPHRHVGLTYKHSKIPLSDAHANQVSPTVKHCIV